QGLPDTQQNDAMIDTLASRLDQQIERLQIRLKDSESGHAVADESAVPLLIALGSPPTRLAKMSQRIEEVEDKLGRELTVEDLVAGVAHIIPVPEDQNKLRLPVSANADLNNDPANIPADAAPTDDLAAQLNGLTVGVGSNGD